MIGNVGITESGNTTPMDTRVPFATPVMDSEQPGAFQLTLEQVTLPTESQEALDQEALDGDIKNPMEPTEQTEATEKEEALPVPDASLHALPLMIPVPTQVLKREAIEEIGVVEGMTVVEGMDRMETADTVGVSSLPRPLVSDLPQELLSRAPLAPPQSQELTDALAMLTPTVDSPREENQEVNLAQEANLPPDAEATFAHVPTPHTEPVTAGAGTTVGVAPGLLPQPPQTVSGQSSPLAFPEAALGAVRLPELSQQLIPMIRRVNEEGNQEIRVRLDPPHLGELNVLIESGKEGLTVRVVAQTRETLLLLQDQRSALQEQLGRQNLSIASFTASLAGDSPGQRSLPHYYQSTSPHSQRDSTATSTEVSAVALRIPLHTGGLDAHA